MKLYSIMGLQMEHVDETCDDIERQYKDGIATEALFSMALFPEGNPVVDKAKLFAEKFGVFSERLAKRGLRAGILVQASIGHGYPYAVRSPFQYLTTLEEGEVTYRTCPYDEGFRAYIKDAFRTLAKTNPTSIMVDDDMRLFGSPKRGCSCPLHLAEISRRIGRKIEREELYSILNDTTEESKKMMQVYFDTQIDALIGAARAMREGIDAVDPTLPGAFCICADTCEGAVDIAKILAGKGNPIVIRVNNGNYTPMGAKNFTNSMCRAATQMAVMGDEVDYFLAETDTCPQNRYSTSAVNLHSHFTGTILEGVAGCKHWITRLGSYEPKAGEAYRKKLAKYSGYYNELSSIVPTLKWQGCKIPLAPGAFTPNLPISEFVYPHQYNGWSTCVLERLGLPMFFSAKDGGVACFDSRRDELFTDEQMIHILSGKVFLAAESAKNLVKRGFGKYIGVDVKEIPAEDKRANVEIIEKTGKRVGRMVGLHELIPTADVKISSMMCAHPAGAPAPTPMFPAVTVFKNELGGTVVTFAGTPMARWHYTTAFSFLCEARKEQLIDLLLDCDSLPVYYPDDAEVYLRAAEMPDGRTFVAVFDISLDPIEGIPLVCQKDVKIVKMLSPDGKWEAVEFTKRDGIITVDTTAYTLDPVMLILE